MRNHSEDAKVFKAFCDVNRLRILEMLSTGEKCACKLLDELQIGQSTLSHHMKILCESGVVVGRKEGKWTYYSISESGSKYAGELLKILTCRYQDEDSVSSGCGQ
ncbi:ArsR/SmtB family transcription factor [Lachnotalea sp. AF33-28]|uniref:ArsR/SmtB family transcription factor n=1 Tax=Lachnotalea sp. AF33-28 TaxID=2292046 RepID=UPI000E4F975F|nr:metalloregulator ArsR/SmtB family transcription factor [Lachnotalea sp. AF33-28]RHP34455.1 ArsR family transcriptional regulator [Lachnotalea sp. AF33-28]